MAVAAVVKLLVVVRVVVMMAAMTMTVHSMKPAAATSPVPPLTSQDYQLCSDVHGTLDSMARVLNVLKAHGKDSPLFKRIHNVGRSNTGTPQNETAHEEPGALPFPFLDLSPIHRMMTAFGCEDDDHDRKDKERAHDTTHDLTHEHVTHRSNAPPTPSSLSSSTHATATQPSLQHARQHHRRVRRKVSAPVVQAGQCTLTSVVNGTCPGAATNGQLTITLSVDDHVDDGTDASGLQAISGSVIQLNVNGHLAEATLQWMFNRGNWTADSNKVLLDGVQFATFRLSVLNPMTGINTIWIRNSALLREVDTSGFQNARGVSQFHVTGCSLATIPDLSGLTSLRVLNLRQNRIRRIAKDNFNGMTMLQQLGLSHNLVSELEPGGLDNLAQLQWLILFSNDISAIPSGLFHPLANLTRLEMHQNPIAKLDADTFISLSRLDHLTLESMLLTSLPPTLFRNTTRLTVLGLANNFITSLPENIFASLSSLQHLQIFDNALTSLSPGVFKGLSALRQLNIGANDLTALPADLLRFNRRLTQFSCTDTKIISLPRTLFTRNLALLQVSFANNRLRSIDNVLQASRPAFLSFLNLDGNDLTQLHLPRTFHRLRRLDLSHNPLRELPDAALTPALRTLRLQDHVIEHIDLAPLLRLANLNVLELDASRQAESRAVVSDITNITSISRLSTLSLENVDISAVVPSIDDLPPLSLDTLHLGWPGASSNTVPMSALCKLLATDVRELRIANTDYRAIQVCPDKTFGSLLLSDNKHLRSITVHNPLRELNVSGCTQLTSINAPPIDILDISNTNVPPSGALCTRWGTRILFARNLVGAIEVRQAAATLRNCLERADVLDFAGNAWLSHLAEVNRITARTIVLSDDAFVTADTTAISNRPIPPILQLTDAPIECALQLSNMDVRPLGSSNLIAPQVVFSFHCTCARGFKLASGGRCVVDTPDIAGIAAGSVIGGLFFGLFVAWLSRRYRGMTKRIGLQEQLLVEMDEEVMALKKAWEIEYDELRMIKRVAAGAFGVVFKAEWDTVMVAVKVLQQAVMAFDESTVLEFEKEVEFLQRTRHPHVVRFFGAGTDPNGSPFLVLEFVTMGSLKDLLGKDMEGVLMEVRNKKIEESSSGGVSDDVNSVWDLKLRLLRDVASGMAFIHSLDQMHRDLKSGNVLVSSSLRAKITDFGSIRQCFTRGGGGRAHGSSHTRLSSTHDVDDPQYSQQAGLQTMTSMTLTAGVGTPLYMAPEALTGDKYSFEADIFSFGVLMWEVATQRVPDLIEQEKGGGYRGPILATISNLLEDGKRLRFDDREEDAIPEWFQSLTFKCMAQSPRERPSFGELKDHHLA
ncbi:TKL protein kinase [Salpingoeca rosetta]|uniref:TKL protein kinase n=1 Tax=Salpingoeca rosetta (strain ATCC 50818 / BSB-021) TaxID=946362 RepID=F2ULX1_SALR5|nr:TKL protein kinase [Salpingoeca rosetta]EGD78120.1 TKL protein kinase [Salpingoeca rosetta]|eukprot:XP_004989796.1 TKL protein kinase [Salpingoeca rosetta]